MTAIDKEVSQLQCSLGRLSGPYFPRSLPMGFPEGVQFNVLL